MPYIAALVQAGVKVGLFGSYWERFSETRGLTQGQLPASEIPRITAQSRLALCLVRRANRDDNSMRTYEIPAIGACMLTEHTPEHEKLFGPEGETVLFFKDPREMVTKANWLLRNEEARRRLARAAQNRIREGGHAYRDRLATILQTVGIGGLVTAEEAAGRR